MRIPSSPPVEQSVFCFKKNGIIFNKENANKIWGA
jgi:hypothetical protein